jgi:hypothetical protein
LQIQYPVIRSGILLVSLFEWFDVYRSNTRRALGKKLVHQMAAYKAAGSANQNMRIPDGHRLHLPQGLTYETHRENT